MKLYAREFRVVKHTVTDVRHPDRPPDETYRVEGRSVYLPTTLRLATRWRPAGTTFFDHYEAKQFIERELGYPHRRRKEEIVSTHGD